VVIGKVVFIIDCAIDFELISIVLSVCDTLSDILVRYCFRYNAPRVC
jgi:hypothetical protein